MGATVIRSPHRDVEIPNVALHELVLAEAAQRGGRTALVDGPTGRLLTYGELAEGVSRMAAGLAARSFGRGDVFAIYAPNVPEYAVAVYGVSAAGGAITTVNPQYTVGELATQLADAGARFLLTSPPLLDQAIRAAARCGVEEVFVFGEGKNATPFAGLLSAVAGAPPSGEIDPATDVVALPYSSGTTGLPKGVMLTHRNLVATLVQWNAVLPMGPEDRLIAVLPFFHTYGLGLLMGWALWSGATLVSMPRFDLEEFLRLLQEQRITRALVVPPVVRALATHPLVASYDLSALQLIGSGAAPLDPRLARACAERIGCPLVQGYGLTETTTAVSSTAGAPLGPRQGSVGVLLPDTEVRVIDPASGEDLGSGNAGEVWVRGPQVMRGYLNAESATAAVLYADGWLRTGDLCRIDSDGYLFVVDRVKELIKYKGYQVAPAELEAVLSAHPLVADAAVVRSPDQEAGEIPKAFVVAREPVSADALMTWVAERVAPHKRIRRVEFVQEIPKGPYGKVLRRTLIERDRSGQG
ncbi:MAG TPA: AMP-binding protein [Micromonospora sp.]|nr:AMP-binding protein [Micromonospora sp.]